MEIFNLEGSTLSSFPSSLYLTVIFEGAISSTVANLNASGFLGSSGTSTQRVLPMF